LRQQVPTPSICPMLENEIDEFLFFHIERQNPQKSSLVK